MALKQAEGRASEQQERTEVIKAFRAALRVGERSTDRLPAGAVELGIRRRPRHDKAAWLNKLAGI